jgi:hypothetical protein
MATEILTLPSPPTPLTHQGVAVLLGNGDGTFQSPLKYNTGTEFVSLAVADFNGDVRQSMSRARVLRRISSAIRRNIAERDPQHASRFSRRDLMKSAGALTGAFALARRLFASNTRASNPPRIAIVGAGAGRAAATRLRSVLRA